MIALNRIAILFAIVSMICIACNKEDEPLGNAEGERMLLIGNSFFRPYAENLDVAANDAGYTEHNSTIVIRGGENGWASSFWNDSTTQESLTIKAALDAGGVELFAMTSGGDPTDPITGHKAWINYALQNNPDIEIGIALPPVDFPASWDSTAQSYGYTNIHDFYPAVVDNWHTSVVDSLRGEFPGINIFSIPTGWATIELAQMQQDDLLDDDIDLFGRSRHPSSPTPKDTKVKL